jgi:hypothetical protein
MSCSTPKTSVDFAFRPAAVRGTCAHDCENGAAADSAPRAVDDRVLVAVADVATSKSVATAPARSQSFLCIDLLRLGGPRVIPRAFRR